MDEFEIYAFYINLEHRADRKQNIEENYKRLGLTKYERIDAIKFKPPLGWAGCTLSFLKAAKRAKEVESEYILICEDDFHVENPELFLRDLKRFLNEGPKDWDALMLGGNNCEKVKEMEDYYVKINKTYGCPGYLIKKSYLDTYIECLEISEKNINTHGDKLLKHHESEYTADVIIGKLQKEHNWYMLFPNGCIQIPSYSDIQNSFMDYSRYMKNLDK
jgi:GR25 family glycosyltransferase involved in LPS biosynthesis